MPPKLIITDETLPRWTSEYNETLRIHYIRNEDGMPILAVNNQPLTTLIMSLPKILKFFMENFRQGHPCRIDIDRVLSNANIELQRQGEKIAKPEPLAD